LVFHTFQAPSLLINKTTQMNCLNDIQCGKRTIIGIRNYVECSNPESDLFINDLPGVSLKIASQIASEELQTGNEVLKKCINTAIKKVFNDFTLKVSPHFNFNAIVQTREVNDFSDSTLIAPASAERGLLLKRWRSELAEIYVEQIYVKIQTAGTYQIKFYNGETLQETIETAIESDVIKTIRVDKRFTSETVKIVIDNTNTAVYSNNIGNWNFQECGTCNGNGQGLVVKGWDGAEENNVMYGIGVKTSVRCYEENLICSLLPRMYFFIWYQSGVEFMKEKIYSDRVNPITTFTKERAKELLIEYQEEYALQYAVFTKNIYSYLRSLKGECLTCNGNRYAQVHP